MKIGIISDTHIPVTAMEIPARIREIFDGVDLILHAGDLIEWRVVEQLGEIARVEAVRGNMDIPETAARLPLKKVLELHAVRIGLIHGRGKPSDIRAYVRREFIDDNVSVIVYGHSHSPCNFREEGILFFNPGSPTDQVYAAVNSVGILEIDNGEVRGEIIEL